MSNANATADTEQTRIGADAGADAGIGSAATIAQEATTPSVGSEESHSIEVNAPNRSRRRWLRTAVAVLVGAVVIAGGVAGYLKYASTADLLAGMRQAETDRNIAAQRAKDYALKSLTYSFEDPDAFFRSVEEGVSPALKDKFTNASAFLKNLMLQAQVSSTGEVVATAVTPQPGEVYEVVVSAYQTTRNLQKPESRVSVMLLQVIVNKVGDTWQVSDIGPKAGSKPATADQIPLPKPGP